MKQNITLDNLNELSDKGKERLSAWFNSKAYIQKTGILDSIHEHKSIWLPLPNLGQMLEFLDEHDINWCWCAFEDIGSVDDAYITRDKNQELCDALWEACLEILNNER